MTPKQELIPKSYSSLLSQLKSTLISSIKEIEKQKVQAYWNTGRLISEHLLENQRAGYGAQLYNRLAEDLGVKERKLYRSAQFFEAFPNLSTSTNLSWSHFCELLSIVDKSKRTAFRSQAVQESWSVKDLRRAIKKFKLSIQPPKEEPKVSAPKLSLTRGRLHTYKIVEPMSTYAVDNLVDLGFKIYLDLPGRKHSFKAGDIVETDVHLRGGQGGEFKRVSATRKELYTYVAYLERVVDADTIIVDIDCGFGIFHKERLRLRGIDCPEISSKRGERAKKFVEQALGGLDFLIIKTHSPDKYGRYLADIFYLQNEADPQTVLESGTFLNQELLNLGLAKAL